MGQKGSAATGKEIWRWFGKRRLRYAVDPDGTKLDILVDEPLQEMAEVSGAMQSQRYYD